jgi:hypothetical protein
MREDYICPKCGNILITTSYFRNNSKVSVTYMICLNSNCKFEPIEIKYIDED